MKKTVCLFAAAILLLALAALSGCGSGAGSDQKTDVPVETAKIGAMTGTVGEIFVETNYPQAKLSRYDGIPDAAMALQAGKLDYVITAYSTALNFVQHNADLELVPGRLTDEGVAIAIGKTDEELLRDISGVLEKFRGDGTLDAVIAAWIKEDGGAYDVLPIPRNEGGEILKVGVAANREPLCFVRDGGIVGLDCELIERIAFELGYRVEYLDMQFSSLIAALESGKVRVVISNVTATAERKEKVNFTNDYFQNPQVLMKKKASERTSGLLESVKSTFLVENRWRLVVDGLLVTVVISLASLMLGTLLGAAICAARKSVNRIVSGASKVYIRVIQGTPIVVMLMILYYIVFGKVDIDAVLVAIIGFSLNLSAYVSEIFRTGIDAVDKGQLEAAAASGFPKFLAFRLITLPQAARHIIPVYKGEFINMVKSTSIVGYIAIQDLTKASDIIRSRTYEAFFPLIVTALIYFAVTYILILALNLVEVKIDPKKRKRVIKGVTP
jgi:polar amino acid transport system substrate-binding protein